MGPERPDDGPERGSEQESALAELSARSDARFRHLLDAAPDAMVVVGGDGLIQLVNVQTEALFGYSRSELIGEQLEILIPARFRRGHGTQVARYFARPGARPMG